MTVQNEKPKVPEVYDEVDAPSYKARVMNQIENSTEEELKELQKIPLIKALTKLDDSTPIKSTLLNLYSNKSEEFCKMCFNFAKDVKQKAYDVDSFKKIFLNTISQLHHEIQK